MTESHFHIAHDTDTNITTYVMFIESSDASFEVRLTELEMEEHYYRLHAFLTKDKLKLGKEPAA